VDQRIKGGQRIAESAELMIAGTFCQSASSQ
jgi:hypothetical protein